MKTLNNYINEWKYNHDKNVKSIFTEFPSNLEDLQKIIRERIKENQDEPYLLDIDTSNILTFYDAFKGLPMKRIDISTWQTGKCGNFVDMFYRCENLEYVNVSKLNLNKLVSCAGMFSGCTKLKTIEGLDTWKFNKLIIKDLNYMFFKCNSLTDIKNDIEGWFDMFNDETTGKYMFGGCDDSILPSWFTDEFFYRT